MIENIIISEQIEVYALQIDEVTDDVTISVQEIVEQYSISIEEIGLQGIPGMSIYEIAVKNGFIGTELQWLESQKLIIFENLNELP